tara:strand:+ start:3237 stop:3704 length:468 start_codon:yes stop_codon:yes gene_type:complete
MYILPALLSKPVIAASVHGTTDFTKPLWSLTPYIYCLIDVDPFIIQSTFLPYSILHFSRDKDLNTSIFLHILWAFVSNYDYNLSWGIFAIYYTYHSLKTIILFDCKFLYIVYILVFLLFPSVDIEINNTMTKIIVSHILSDELFRVNNSAMTDDL